MHDINHAIAKVHHDELLRAAAEARLARAAQETPEEPRPRPTPQRFALVG